MCSAQRDCKSEFKIQNKQKVDGKRKETHMQQTKKHHTRCCRKTIRTNDVCCSDCFLMCNICTSATPHIRVETWKLCHYTKFHLDDVRFDSYSDSRRPGCHLTHWVTMQTEIDLAASRAGDKSHNEKCNQIIWLRLLGGFCPHIQPTGLQEINLLVLLCSLSSTKSLQEDDALFSTASSTHCFMFQLMNPINHLSCLSLWFQAAEEFRSLLTSAPEVTLQKKTRTRNRQFVSFVDIRPLHFVVMH